MTRVKGVELICNFYFDAMRQLASGACEVPNAEDNENMLCSRVIIGGVQINHILKNIPSFPQQDDVVAGSDETLLHNLKDVVGGLVPLNQAHHDCLLDKKAAVFMDTFKREAITRTFYRHTLLSSSLQKKLAKRANILNEDTW